VYRCLEKKSHNRWHPNLSSSPYFHHSFVVVGGGRLAVDTCPERWGTKSIERADDTVCRTCVDFPSGSSPGDLMTQVARSDYFSRAAAQVAVDERTHRSPILFSSTATNPIRVGCLRAVICILPSGHCVGDHRLIAITASLLFIVGTIKLRTILCFCFLSRLSQTWGK